MSLIFEGNDLKNPLGVGVDDFFEYVEYFHLKVSQNAALYTVIIPYI